jgi:hypothetical protein
VIKRLSLGLLLAAAASSSAWAEDGRGIDVQAYCRQAYGSSAGIAHVRTDGNSWRCTVGTRQYPVDMDAVCKQQYDATYTGLLGNPADSFSWSCVRKKTPPK